MRILANSVLLLAVLSVPSYGAQAASTPSVKISSVKALRMEGIQRQTRDYSCGAASLAILLQQYFGDTFGEKELLYDIVYRLSAAEMDDRIRTGFSMLDLKQAAERLGYDAEGVVLPQEAVGKLQGPVIVLLRREKINHFVVLKGAVAGRAFLADPVRGHLRVPLHDFFKEWQGEALVLGREGFGLPLNHPLSIPRAAEAAPEYEAVRALLHVQP